MTQQLAALRVMSDEFFQNSFFECKIAISTLQFCIFLCMANSFPKALKRQNNIGMGLNPRKHWHPFHISPWQGLCSQFTQIDRVAPYPMICRPYRTCELQFLIWLYSHTQPCNMSSLQDFFGIFYHTEFLRKKGGHLWQMPSLNIAYN